MNTTKQGKRYSVTVPLAICWPHDPGENQAAALRGGPMTLAIRWPHQAGDFVSCWPHEPAQVAAVLGVSGERVRQIEEEAIKHLKHNATLKELYDESPE